MELTGRCEEDFDGWLLRKHFSDIIGTNKGDFSFVDLFSHLPESMQYGVYVDFFDSVSLEINSGHCIPEPYFYYEINNEDDKMGTYFKSRQEARTAAIEKANEIYNN